MHDGMSRHIRGLVLAVQVGRLRTVQTVPCGYSCSASSKVAKVFQTVVARGRIWKLA